MKSLPEKHQKNGWIYKMVERNGCAAIYSQSKHPDLPINGKACAYEVVLLRVKKACDAGNFIFEGGEILPHDEQWGQRGWTCHTLERAREKLREVSTPERIAVADKARAALVA